ncbi:MAG: hypothetical protein NTY14_01975, partial [Candidatus Omnitrophica bacterium]|nr:hypothetical protein [Candidatus Omnitrophota bacterium]
MKIRTRLAYLLIILALIFLSVFMIQKKYEHHRLIQLLESVQTEREYIFERILSLQEKLPQTFAYDYSFWDEMVNFVTAPNKKWSAENIDTGLNTYQVNGVWVYNLDNQLVYSVNNLKEEAGLKEIPIPSAAISSLFTHTPFRHFFANTPKGLMEFWGATIQGSSDAKRELPAQGYLFCSRLWAKSYVDELSQLTGSTAALSDTAENKPIKLEQDSVSFSRILTGWDNQPVKYLLISVSSQAIANAKKSAVQVAVLFLGFFVVILLIFSFFIFYWINIPLKLITLSLKNGDSVFLKKLKKQNTEFGDVSRMVDSFFTQRKTILEDITESKRTDEELRAAYKRLEQTQHELIQSSKMAAMGQLAAGISHELNQPLTGIKGFAQALLMDLEKGSPFRKDLNEIVAQVGRMDAIIKNVRFFARKSDFNNIELDINQVILNSLMLVSQQLKTHNIRAILELDPDIPKIQGDPNQLQQAFLNIINNARDAILGLNRPEGGEILIRTS